MSGDITPNGRPAGSGFPAPIRRQTPDRAVSGVRFPVVDNLAMIAEDDDFLSAIATGGFGELFQPRREVRSSPTGQTRSLTSAPPLHVEPTGHRPAGLGPLLAAWRSEIVDPPLPLLPVLPPRVMNAPADRSRSRSLRPLLSVAAAICALLMASTAVGAHSAQPGEPLWALTQVLWSGHAQSVEAKFSASNNIMLAQRALTDGDPQQASIALKAAFAEMADVSPDDGLTQLQHDWAEVNTKVAVVVAAQASSGSTGGRPPSGISVPGDVPIVGALPVTTTTSSSPTAGSSTSPGHTATSGSVAPPAATLPPLTSGPGPNNGSAPSVSSSSSAGNPPSAGGQPVAPAPVVPTSPGSAAPVTTSAGSVPTSSPSPAGPGSSVGSTVVPPPPAPTTDPASPAPTSNPVAPPSTSSPSGTTTDPTTASAPPSSSAPASTEPPTSATDPGTTAGTDTSTTSAIPTAGTSTSATTGTTDPGTMGTDTTTTQTAAAGSTGESTPWYSTDGGTTAGSPAP